MGQKEKTMKLKDCRDNHDTFSSRTSEIVRSLAFAGIALIWVFKNEFDKSNILPTMMFKPAVLIIFVLLFDLLHYVWGTLAWGAFHRIKEWKSVPETDDFKAPRWINWPTNFFFWLKIISLFIAYGFLLISFWEKIHSPTVPN